MSYDPLKRDSSWKMFVPGLYVDPAGYGHVFPDEFLAFLAHKHPEAGFDPESKDDYDLIVRWMREAFPDVPFKMVKHERERN